jgi:hypothetical protein
MSFPSKDPSSHPPGLALGVFADGGPFPRLVAPGIVVGDPAQFSPGAGTSAGRGSMRGSGHGRGRESTYGRDRGITLPANGTDARLDAG